MRIVRTFFPIVLFSAAAALAQRPGSGGTPQFETLDQRSLALNIFANRENYRSKQQAGAQPTQEFVERIEAFKAAWRALLNSSTNGLWNPKQAKAVRKAFERLVQSQAWVESAR